MRILYNIFIYLFLLVYTVAGQEVEMVEYTTDFQFEDGFYINFSQVKNNIPIPAARIITNLDHTSNDFYKEILSQKTLSFFDKLGVKQSVSMDNVWGFSRNGVLYIQVSEGFSRVTIIGQICHFVATITSYDTRYYDPYYYSPYYNPYAYSPRTTKNSEVKQFLIDFNTGDVLDYDYKNLEILLMEDPELYDEYVALRKRKKKQLKFYYIRKFNERNPLYLPVKKIR